MKHLRFIILMYVATVIILLSGCFRGKVEVVLDTDYANPEISEEEKEYWDFVYGEADVLAENDLLNRVYEQTEIDIIGSYTKNSELVEVNVVAPDIYGYVMDNLDILMNLEEEVLHDHIMEYIDNPDSPRREENIKLHAEFINDTLVVNTDTFEYQDAISGGLHSVMTDIYVEIISGMGDLNE